MDKTTVIALRDMLKANNGKVSLVCDNMQIYNERTDVIIWDDTAGIVYVIRTNDNHRDALDGMPFKCDSFEYSNIQYIDSSITIEKLNTILLSFVSKGILAVERKDSILEYFVKYSDVHKAIPQTEPVNAE